MKTSAIDGDPTLVATGTLARAASAGQGKGRICVSPRKPHLAQVAFWASGARSNARGRRVYRRTANARWPRGADQPVGPNPLGVERGTHRHAQHTSLTSRRAGGCNARLRTPSTIPAPIPPQLAPRTRLAKRTAWPLKSCPRLKNEKHDPGSGHFGLNRYAPAKMPEADGLVRQWGDGVAAVAPRPGPPASGRAPRWPFGRCLAMRRRRRRSLAGRRAIGQPDQACRLRSSGRAEPCRDY
jgi:hypothetical protein